MFAYKAAFNFWQLIRSSDLRQGVLDDLNNQFIKPLQIHSN
jgi:hypothetical protein